MAVKGQAGKKKAVAQAEKPSPEVEEAEAPKKKSKLTPEEKEAKAPSKPEKVEEPEEEDDGDGSDDEGDESEDDESAESEEEAEAAAKGAIVVSKGVPAGKEASAKKRKTKAHRLEEAQARADSQAGGVVDEHIPKGVIYIGHIPYGFGEPQMRKYFNQFGTVLRLRLSRSKKRAVSKGYAFVEFEEEDVAKIVAQTMDGYLIFGKKLVCHMVEKAKMHPKLFKGWSKKMVNYTKTRMARARKVYNDRPTIEVDGEQVSRTTERQVQQRLKRNTRLAALLKTLEVDYDLSEFQVPDSARKQSPKFKAADSPKIKASGAPKLKVASSPKLEVASSPKVAPKVSIEEIMEEVEVAVASAPKQEAAPATEGAGKASKGKKRKKATA